MIQGGDRCYHNAKTDEQNNDPKSDLEIGFVRVISRPFVDWSISHLGHVSAARASSDQIDALVRFLA